MSYESQLLKWKMEEVWKTRGCASPSRVAVWHEDWKKGWRFYNREKTFVLLWFTHGKLLGFRKPKIKGKGFSFLHKDYGRYWHIRSKP